MSKPYKEMDVGYAHCLKDINQGNIYMVENEVWAATGLPKRDKEVFVQLHIHCLEKRIKRNLTLEDFTEARCNHNIENRLRRIHQNEEL